MNTIHYIVVGAKSPAGRAYIQALSESGVDIKHVTAIDVKAGQISYGETTNLTISDPHSYRQIPNRKMAHMVLASPNAALIDVADDHLDDDGQLLDLTGHYLTDPDAVLAPADGHLVVQPSTVARMIHRLVQDLPAQPQTIQLNLLLPASHFGKDGMDELFQQTRQFVVAEDLDHSVFPKKLAFNVLPYAGTLGDDGVSSEEVRFLAELRHLFPDVKAVINAVVVPVFIGLSAQVVLYYDEGKAVTPHAAMAAWRRDRQVRVIDPQSELIAVSPSEIAGDDLVSVSRVYTPPGLSNALSFWAVVDNTIY